MPMGTNFNLTDNRKLTILKMLSQQHTIESIALHFKVNPGTIKTKLKQGGINLKDTKLAGISSLRARAYNMIDSIEDPAMSFKAMVTYLKHYDKEVIDNKQEERDTSKVTIEII